MRLQHRLALAECLSQLGIPKEKLGQARLNAVVVAEFGPGARLMDPGWVREIRDKCVAAKVPFFFKQWGGRNRRITGRILDGRTWDELPSTAVTA